MKKIQKSIMMLAALLTAGAALTSCSNEESIAEVQKPADGKYIMTVEATKCSDALTRALALNSDGALIATWKKGDVVEVYKNLAGTLVKLGELTAKSSGVTTKLTGALDELPAVGSEIELYTPSWNKDYTGQIGTFENLDKYDYAWYKVTVTGIDNVNNTITTSPAQFYNLQSIVKFTLTDQDNEAIPAKKLTVNFKNPDMEDALLQTSADVSLGDITITPDQTEPTNEIWAALEIFGSYSYTLSLIASTDAKVYFYTKNNVAFKNSKYYTASVKMKELKKISSSDAMTVIPAVFGGGFTPLSNEQAWRLAKAQKSINGGSKNVLVIYKIEGTDPNTATCYYASSADETPTENSGDQSALMTIYLQGNSQAYYVEE